MGNDLGYFSVLRWRHDATRDEARNVAVLLVEAEGQFGAMKAAPISSISAKLREQGLLDAMLVGLERRLSGVEGTRPNVIELASLQESSRLSLYFTEPKAVSVSDVDLTIGALYRAYVAPRTSGPSFPTKGKILDSVVSRLRNGGAIVKRGEYVQDFLFDLIIGEENQALAEVVSFASPNKIWSGVEFEVGHFLYGLERVGAQGYAVVQPPTEHSQPTAFRSHERILRWLDLAKVPTIDPGSVDKLTSAY